MIDENSQPPSAEHSGRTESLSDTLEKSLRREKARRFRKGDRVTGRVRMLGESMAFIDLGGPADGLLDLTEMRRPDGTLDLEEGTRIEAIVVGVATNGVLLKRSLVTQEESLEQLRAAHAAGIPVPAKVVGQNKGGLELDLFGLRAFCPASQVDVHRVDDLGGYVGQTMQFRISEISLDGKKIVLSHRALLQEEHDRKLAELKAALVPGAVVRGKVVRLQPFGAFVDLGGIEALCHVTELSRARIHDAAEAVKVGDQLDFEILKAEETTDKSGRRMERIALSRRALEKDPWEGAAERFPVGARVPGKVVRLQPFGAFIELAPGVDGLAHISTLSEQRIEHPSEAVKEGDLVDAWVIAVEPDKKRLSLSLKEPRPAEPKASKPRTPRSGRPSGSTSEVRRPEKSAQSGHSVGAVHDATVERVEPFGVFVSLPGGGRALVPSAELGVTKNADQKIDYRKHFAVGSPLRVAITEIRRGELKASKLEADRADERSMVREWTSSQKKSGGGGGFGTLGDLFRGKVEGK